MKKTMIYIMIGICLIFSSCGYASRSSAAADVTDPVVITAKLSKSLDTFKGKDFNEVVSIMQTDGFSNFSYDLIEDVNPTSEIKYGTVESVSINSKSDVSEGQEFPSDSIVLIKYHSKEKYNPPFSSDQAKDIDVSEAISAFEDAGYTNIKTEEVYDIDPDTAEKTQITEVKIEGNSEFKQTDAFVYDSDIVVLSHMTFEKYTVKLEVDFLSNLLFDKYDIDVYVNGNKEYSLPHGKDLDCSLRFPKGKQTITFEGVNENLSEDLVFDVDCDIDASYKLSCHNNYIELSEVYVDKKGLLNTDEAKVMNSEAGFIGNTYKVVEDNLKECGFINIELIPVYDIVWGFTPTESVKSVLINGGNTYKRGDIFKKNTSVKIYYHMRTSDDPANQSSASSSSSNSSSKSNDSGNKNSASNNKVETSKAKTKEVSLNDAVEVTVVEKTNIPSSSRSDSYSDRVNLKIHVHNKTDRPIRGVQGVLTVNDLFGKKILSSNCNFTGFVIQPNVIASFSDKGMDVNEYIDSQVKFYNEKYEDLQFSYNVKKIVYNDEVIEQNTTTGSSDVTVKCTSKTYIPVNWSKGIYDSKIKFVFTVENNTDKAIRGVQGTLQTNDIFGNKIQRNNCDFTGETIAAKSKVTFERYLDYNMFDDDDETLRNTNYEDLVFTYNVTEIVYK